MQNREPLVHIPLDCFLFSETSFTSWLEYGSGFKALRLDEAANTKEAVIHLLHSHLKGILT